MKENSSDIDYGGHLIGAEKIMERFGVSRRMVKTWYRMGAPIAFANGRFDADYSALQAWRVSPGALTIFSGKQVDNNQCTDH